nr:hypothetical protein [Tanacetum cinerariifolium]
MRGIPTHLPQEGHAPQNFANSNMPSQNGFEYPANMPTNIYPFYTQPMYTFPNVPVYTNLNLIGAVLNPAGLATPFVRLIEDYPLLDGLKIPSHIVACHMFTYTIKDSARIWWNSQKAGSILDYEDLKHLSTYLSSTYKGLMEKTYTWDEAREVATNGVLNNLRDDFERSKKFSWGNSIGQKDRGRFSPYKGQNHKLLSNLVKTPREILATEKVAKTFEQPPRLPGANWSKDKTRYYHFYEDYGHETNQCRELKHQIKEAVKSGQLAHQ